MRRYERKGLASKYVLLGTALCALESATSHSGVSRSRLSHRAYREFRSSVAFLSAELLESYWDDLLNWRVPESALFIQSQVAIARKQRVIVGLVGCVAAICLFIDHLGGSSAGLLIGACLAVMAASRYFNSDTTLPHRRLWFAEIVAFEIARRRGSRRPGRRAPLAGRIAAAFRDRPRGGIEPGLSGAA